MGLLDRFRKEEHVHFERDSSGEVVDVQRSGDVDKTNTVSSNGETYTRGSTPVSDALLKQQKPKQSGGGMVQKFGYAVKRIDKGIVNYNRTRNPMRGNHNPWGSMFDTGMNRRSARNYSTRNNYNPWGSMFDKGMKRPKKGKKSGSRTSFGGYDMYDNWGFMK